MLGLLCSRWLLCHFSVAFGAFSSVFRLRLKVRSKHIEAVFCRSCKQASVLGMEAELLHLVLTLMEEHHLGRNLHVKLLIDILRLVSFVDLDREIPEGHFVVGGGDGEYGLLPWLELN